VQTCGAGEKRRQDVGVERYTIRELIGPAEKGMFSGQSNGRPSGCHGCRT